jgi:hypothetical protein
MTIVIGTLILSADLRLASSSPSKPAARQATVGPKGGVPVTIERVSNPKL